MNLEIAADARNRCGEAPLWDAREPALYWVDIEARQVWRREGHGGRWGVWASDVGASGLALHQRGGLVVGGAGGISRLQSGSSPRPIAAHACADVHGVNDILAAPGGRLYAGTLFWDEKGMTRTGQLLCIHPCGRVDVVDDGVELANGLALSPDDRTLYFADSAARSIYAYDVDSATGALSRKRVWARISPEHGIPDGLTVDAAGFVWCALWYGGQVARFDPEGRIERRLHVPAQQTSSVAFGGADLDELYITTAAQPWPSDLAPDGFDAATVRGGALYRARPGVQGRSEHAALTGG